MCCLLRLFSRFRRCCGCAWYATIWGEKPTIWWEIRDDIDVRRCPLTEAHKFVNKFNLYTFKLKGPCYGWLSSDTGWQNLRNYMRMLRLAIRVKQVCLPHIISNITNNKNALWKTVRLTSFQKNITIAIRLSLLQICPSVTRFLFAVLIIRYFYVLSGYFYVSPIWWQIPSFDWILINFLAPLPCSSGSSSSPISFSRCSLETMILHSCLTGMSNCTICLKRVASHWYLETFIFTSSKFVVAIHVCLFHPKPS